MGINPGFLFQYGYIVIECRFQVISSNDNLQLKVNICSDKETVVSVYNYPDVY